MSKIYHSPVTELPHLPHQSIYSYLFPSNGGQNLDTPVFVDGLSDRRVNGRELRSQARRLAGGLRNGLDVRRGDVCCVFGQNSLEWLNAVYGCLAAGVIISPINHGYGPDEVVHQLKDSKACLVFVSPALHPTLLQALRIAGSSVNIPTERIILLAGEDDGKDGSSAPGPKCISALWGEEFEPEIFCDGNEHETAWLCYSSGTTGLAKGVATTHFNMTSQVQCVNAACEPLDREKDVALAFLPFGHMYALALSVHQPLTLGITTIILPRFDEKVVFRVIEKYRVTWSLVVPPNLITMRNSVIAGQHDISSLRGAMSAAAPLSIDLCRAVEKRFPNCRITQGYGLTEISPLTHAMTLDAAVGRQGSIGALLPHTIARLVDPDTLQDAEVGQPGELWVQSPSVMKGYWRNQEATRKTFSDDGIWFKTGDMAIVDPVGYFEIVDRLKELVKYKGYQVAPAELEGLLLTNPMVADVAVIGIEDRAQATELPRAYVVARDPSILQSKLTRDAFSVEIVEWVQSKVANHKRLRGGVIVVKEIPKSPTGKILRKILRAKAAAEEKAKIEARREAKL